MTTLSERVTIRGTKTGLTFGEISSEVGRYLAETNLKRFFDTHGKSAFLAKFETDIQDRLLAAEDKRKANERQIFK